MNVQSVVNTLQTLYPGKKIIKNNEENPTEILCEVEPTSEHPEYDVAIAVIDQSVPHYHKKTKEIYEVTDGELIVTIDNKQYFLKKGESIVIHPGQVHSASGHASWIKATSCPGWTPEDHILQPSIDSLRD